MYKMKKSLGQHFLKDDAIITRILENVDKKPGTNLLEIGPGGGALTKHLSKIHGINFKAVELDEEKAYFLIKQYPELEGKVIMEDFLQMKKPLDIVFKIDENEWQGNKSLQLRMIDFRLSE